MRGTWTRGPLTPSNGPGRIGTFTCIGGHSGAQWCAACEPSTLARPRRFGTSAAARLAVKDGHRGQEHAVARAGDHFAAARMIARTGRGGRRRWLSIRGRHAGWIPLRLLLRSPQGRRAGWIPLRLMLRSPQGRRAGWIPLRLLLRSPQGRRAGWKPLRLSLRSPQGRRAGWKPLRLLLRSPQYCQIPSFCSTGPRLTI